MRSSRSPLLASLRPFSPRCWHIADPLSPSIHTAVAWHSDSPRQSLSSTWSWFGSVPIGSEPDPRHRRHGARPHSRDDPLYGPDLEKDASVSIGPPFASPHTQIQFATPISLHVPVEHASSGLSPPPWSRKPLQPANEKGAAQLLALVARAFSSSPQPMDAAVNPSRGVTDDAGRSWDVRNVHRGVEVQRAHNPFADPRTSRISDGSTVASTSDVMSVEAL